MSTVEILRAARAKIAQGWSQGGGPGDPCMCMALWEVFDAPAWDAEIPVLDALLRAIDSKPGAGVTEVVARRSSVFAWNDARNRTHAEVLAAFDRAIAVEEAREAEFTATPERETVTA